MSTFDYARSRDTADRLIARFGQAGTIRRTVVTGGNAYDPTSGTATTTDHAATLVVTEFSNSEIDGTRVLATDKKVLVAAGGLAITPEPGDKVVEADGTIYDIVPPVMPLKPAGTVVMYQVQCRR